MNAFLTGAVFIILALNYHVHASDSDTDLNVVLSDQQGALLGTTGDLLTEAEKKIIDTVAMSIAGKIISDLKEMVSKSTQFYNWNLEENKKLINNFPDSHNYDPHETYIDELSCLLSRLDPQVINSSFLSDENSKFTAEFFMNLWLEEQYTLLKLPWQDNNRVLFTYDGGIIFFGIIATLFTLLMQHPSDTKVFFVMAAISYVMIGARALAMAYGQYNYHNHYTIFHAKPEWFKQLILEEVRKIMRKTNDFDELKKYIGFLISSLEQPM